MTAGELIEALKQFPPETLVMIRDHESGSEDWYGYDEAEPVQRVLGPSDPDNYWRSGGIMILG